MTARTIEPVVMFAITLHQNSSAISATEARPAGVRVVHEDLYVTICFMSDLSEHPIHFNAVGRAEMEIGHFLPIARISSAASNRHRNT
jgi:hypothetical protein